MVPQGKEKNIDETAEDFVEDIKKPDETPEVKDTDVVEEEQEEEIEKVAMILPVWDEQLGFWERLANLQNEAPKIEKKWYNKHLSYHYALLDDVLRAYKPLLTKYWFVLYNQFKSKEKMLFVILQDTKSDVCLSTDYEIKGSSDQQIGASLTYWRRYGAWILLNVATEEDTDWPQQSPNNNNNSYPKKTQPKKQQPKPKVFTDDEKASNFSKHYEIINASKDLKQLQENFISFNLAWKAPWFFAETHIEQIKQLKDDMKRGYEEQEEINNVNEAQETIDKNAWKNNNSVKK